MPDCLYSIVGTAPATSQPPFPHSAARGSAWLLSLHQSAIEMGAERRRSSYRPGVSRIRFRARSRTALSPRRSIVSAASRPTSTAALSAFSCFCSACALPWRRPTCSSARAAIIRPPSRPSQPAIRCQSAVITRPPTETALGARVPAWPAPLLRPRLS